jgi:hypothetical protein
MDRGGVRLAWVNVLKQGQGLGEGEVRDQLR